jgi:hypothetical protein
MKAKAKGGKKRPAPRQRAQSGSRDPKRQQQAASGEGQQYGEGNYKATRQYNEGMKEHVEHHDIEREARDAAPRSAAEEKEMEEAERIGRSRARGDERPSPETPKTKKA